MSSAIWIIAIVLILFIVKSILKTKGSEKDNSEYELKKLKHYYETEKLSDEEIESAIKKGKEFSTLFIFQDLNNVHIIKAFDKIDQTRYAGFEYDLLQLCENTDQNFSEENIDKAIDICKKLGIAFKEKYNIIHQIIFALEMLKSQRQENITNLQNEKIENAILELKKLEEIVSPFR